MKPLQSQRYFRLTNLRRLAAEIGYTLERAPVRGCWFLFDQNGEKAVTEEDTTVFSTQRAIAFLKRARKYGGVV